MRRVHVIHAARPFLSGTTLASVLFLLAVWGLGREVWVSHIVQNMPQATNIAALTRFFTAAFLNTRFVVQVLTLLAGTAFVYALADFMRALRTNYRFA